MCLFISIINLKNKECIDYIQHKVTINSDSKLNVTQQKRNAGGKMERNTELLRRLTGKHFNVAYLTPETFCDNDELQTAAGGLGVVADSWLYELENNFSLHKLTAIQIAIYCSHGYQKQIVKPINGGFMNVVYEKDPNPELTIDTGLRFNLVFAEKNCTVGVRVPLETREHTARLLLDTDIPENDEAHRVITRVLYGEGHATKYFSEDGKSWDNINWLRILQAGVLGLGSYYILKELQITYDKLHLNESHPVFFLVHELGDHRKNGRTIGSVLEEIHQRTVFTNHTILDSGNKRYPTHDISRALKHYAGFEEEELRMLGQRTDHSFSMTEAALFLAGPHNTNGVSVDHARIANELWPGYDIIPITNGVSARYQHPEFRNLTKASDIPKLKLHFKEILYESLTQRLREAGWEREIRQPNMEAVLVTWARRQQEYKRSGLMWRDSEFELVKMLLNWNYIAIAWGGYVHPDDEQMMNRWNEYWQKFRDLPNTIAIFNYRLSLIRSLLKAASQIWLNTPWFGHEACGTSWMSSMLECGLNISIWDGGIQEAKNFVSFGNKEKGDWHQQYKTDALSLWQAVLPNVLLLRDNNEELLEKIFNAKLEAEEKFSSTRMVTDYIHKLYRMR